MKVAFVTPRYGLEVMGGAEAAARQLAEHLVADCGSEVEVFSTCALDHITWDDVLPAGDSILNGVTVHRFASTSGRVRAFYDLDARLRVAPAEASLEESSRWLELNGPVTPDLVDAVRHSDAEVIAFYPYLYYPTVKGMEAARAPRVLHPAAHDEPADLAFHDIPGRVARKLLELAAARAQPRESGPLIALRLSQQTLAGLVGASRENVNRALSRFASLGLLKVERGHITLLRPEELRRRSM